MNDVRIGFLGYTTNTAEDGISPDIGSAIATDGIPGGNYYALDDIREDIRTVTGGVDLLVISFHWGYEYYRYPSPKQIELAHAMIDTGADIVVWHHPHGIHRFEQYGGGVILYSVGNFFFWNYDRGLGHPTYGNEFVIVRCDAGPEGMALHFVPGRMDRDNRLRLLEDTGPFDERLHEYSEMLHRPDYETFWDGYRRDMQRYLENVSLKHAARIVKHPADMIGTLRKIRKYGLWYVFQRLKSKLSAKARLLKRK